MCFTSSETWHPTRTSSLTRHLNCTCTPTTLYVAVTRRPLRVVQMLNLPELSMITRTSSCQFHQQDLRFYNSKIHIFHDFQFAGSLSCTSPEWVGKSQKKPDERSEDGCAENSNKIVNRSDCRFHIDILQILDGETVTLLDSDKWEECHFTLSPLFFASQILLLKKLTCNK